MFAKILARLDQQDKDVERRHDANRAVLDDILDQTKSTNGRVTTLEGHHKYRVGWMAGAAAIGGGVIAFAWHVIEAWLWYKK